MAEDTVDTTSTSTAAIALSDEESEQIDRLFGWVSPTESELELEIRSEIELLNRREEFVAACMEREGFDYVPLRQDFAISLIEDPDIPRDTAAWFETYGFGISTLAYPTNLVAPDAVGFDPAWLNSSPPNAEDNPNAVYYRGLDQAGQAAYSETLSGPDGTGGCAEAARVELPDPGRFIQDVLVEQIEELDERIRSSAAFFEATAEVDGCMQIEGFVFDGYDSFEPAIMAELTDLGLISPAPADGTVISSAEDGEDSDRQAGASLVVGSPDWRVALADVQAFETLLATEFDRCSGRDAWFARIDALAGDIRSEFIAANYAQIAPTVDPGGD